MGGGAAAPTLLEPAVEQGPSGAPMGICLPAVLEEIVNAVMVTAAPQKECEAVGGADETDWLAPGCIGCCATKACASVASARLELTNTSSAAPEGAMARATAAAAEEAL